MGHVPKETKQIAKSKTGWEQCVERQLWENIGKTKRKTRIPLKADGRKNMKTARNDGVLLVVFGDRFQLISAPFRSLLASFWIVFGINSIKMGAKIIKNRSLGGPGAIWAPRVARMRKRGPKHGSRAALGALFWRPFSLICGVWCVVFVFIFRTCFWKAS